MKPVKFAVSVALFNPGNKKEVLAVLRPSNDDSLPSIWGLPTVSSNKMELPEEAVRRVGKEKLATQIDPLSLVGIKAQDRKSYELILMVIQAKLTGRPPSVQNAPTENTKYDDQRWVSDYSIFIEGAAKGSVCDQIFLESQNINWK